MQICKFCNKECKNYNSLINHERLCKSNANRQISSIEIYKKNNPLPWNKGKNLHYEVGTKGKPGTFTGKKHTDATKYKMSETIKNRYASGWESTCGRCKKYDYESPTAGKIKVDGTWELKVARYLDTIGVTWKRNKIRFDYIRPDGKLATYQPDFYIDDWKSYLEVKGYETDLDRAKWSQFTAPLIVWKRKEIENLGNVSAGG